ncbi:hypothetical protein [Pontibacter cellulosilyticus]|uniref:hypothetical protein n=1 Tax=Pontibacter cellulosilyticus TaxID=1720253 RepID=UPI001E4F1631|nr:hypothetical protein [Pontibacter cellulosilyticus]
MEGILLFACFSPRRLGLTFLLDEKSKQKNQDNFELAERSDKKSSVVHLAKAVAALQ